MGKEGTKVAAAVNVKEIIKDLNRAYADEWLAHYSYLYMARTCTGMMYEDMSEFLESKRIQGWANRSKAVITILPFLPGSLISLPVFGSLIVER